MTRHRTIRLCSAASRSCCSRWWWREASYLRFARNEWIRWRRFAPSKPTVARRSLPGRHSPVARRLALSVLIHQRIERLAPRAQRLERQLGQRLRHRVVQRVHVLSLLIEEEKG